MKAPAKDTAPTIESFTVARRYLTEREVERLMDTARKVSRRGHRDATMILVAYRHGLRASEVCDLQWHQIELDQGRLHVRRAKRGTPSIHPIRGDEIRALRKLQRENPTEAYVFISGRGGPMSTLGFHHHHRVLRCSCRADRTFRFLSFKIWVRCKPGGPATRSGEPPSCLRATP